MELQEIFDTVVKHLHEQNSQSVDEKGSCMYRGVDGKKCAVGCLIPDDLYSKDIETHGSGATEVRHVLAKAGVIKSEDDIFTSEQLLLNSLQRFHDYELECKSNKEYLESLEYTAGLHNLKFNPLDYPKWNKQERSLQGLF